MKGIVRADDAISALDAGAAAIIVSNHGGRQLDSAVSTVSLTLDKLSLCSLRSKHFPKLFEPFEDDVRHGLVIRTASLLFSLGVR